MAGSQPQRALFEVRRLSAALLLPVLGALLFVAFVASLALGSVRIPTAALFRLAAALFEPGRDLPDELEGYALIVGTLRAPRAAAATLVGLVLGSCGAAMQGVFRNPLASPYLLGVASGANMGAALAIVVGFSTALGGLGLPIGAFAGGTVAVVTVYGISRARVGGETTNTLILAGVALGAFFSAVTSFLVFLSGTQMVEIILWIMGSVGVSGWRELLWLTPIAAGGLAVLSLRAHDLNALALGDSGAHHRGVDPERARAVIAITVTAMTAGAVALAGPIGFVGLITPHALRLLVGPDQRVLLPGSALAGAFFLLVTDTVARTVLSPAELPVGVVTAALGGPFFLYLLLRRRGGTIR